MNKRTHVIEICVTAEERDRIKAAAFASGGQTVSGWMRALALRTADLPNKRPNQ